MWRWECIVFFFNEGVREYIAYFRDTLGALVAARNAKLLLIGDTPYGGTSRLRQGNAAMAQLAASSAHIYFFNPFDVFCSTGTCEHNVPGTQTSVLVDNNHLSYAGQRYVAPFLCSFIHSAGIFWIFCLVLFATLGLLVWTQTASSGVWLHLGAVTSVQGATFWTAAKELVKYRVSTKTKKTIWA